MTSHLPAGRARAGLTPKGCLVAVAAVAVVSIVVAAGVVYLAHSYLRGLTDKPLQMPTIEQPDKVQEKLEAKVQVAQAELKGTRPCTLTLTADELNVLLAQQLPESVKGEVYVAIEGDRLRVIAPVRGAILASLVPAEFSTVQSYVRRLEHANIEATGKLGVTDGRASFELLTLTRPLPLPVAQIQPMIDQVLRDRGADLKISVGALQGRLSSLTVEGGQIHAQISAP